MSETNIQLVSNARVRKQIFSFFHLNFVKITITIILSPYFYSRHNASMIFPFSRNISIFSADKLCSASNSFYRTVRFVFQSNIDYEETYDQDKNIASCAIYCRGDINDLFEYISILAELFSSLIIIWFISQAR